MMSAIALPEPAAIGQPRVPWPVVSTGSVLVLPISGTFEGAGASQSKLRGS